LREKRRILFLQRGIGVTELIENDYKYQPNLGPLRIHLLMIPLTFSLDKEGSIDKL